MSNGMRVTCAPFPAQSIATFGTVRLTRWLAGTPPLHCAQLIELAVVGFVRVGDACLSRGIVLHGAVDVLWYCPGFVDRSPLGRLGLV